MQGIATIRPSAHGATDMFRNASLLLFALFLLPACERGTPFASERPPLQNAAGEFATQLTVDRAEIRPGEEFTGSYSFHNHRTEPVQLLSGCTALARGTVYRNAELVDFVGSSGGCREAVSAYEVAAGETLTVQWQVRATVVRVHADGRPPELAPAEPGPYVFRVEPDVIQLDGESFRLPALEQSITVR